MSRDSAPSELRPPLPSDAALLREVLAEAGFTDKALIERFGSATLPTPRTRNLPRLLRMSAGGMACDIFARLFLFHMPVPAEALRKALAPFPLEELGRMGLVEARGTDVAATAILYPYGPNLLLFDPPERILSGAPRDLVMGVSSSTTDLANFTVRRSVGDTLDVGCGSGFHAFLASGHSRHVVGVDISPRAVAFARMGAALSGVANAEFLTGDRFEPVRGRRFDLIVANLPFVISPAGRYFYRDGGMPVDCFVQSVLQEAPDYLAEGGMCQVICDWAHQDGQDWQERLRGWFENSGCDVWAVKLSTIEVAVYAEMWIRDTEEDSAENFARCYGEWTAFYDANRITAVSTGLIAIRRRSAARNWFRTADCPEHPPEDFGRHVDRRFALYDFLETIGDEAALLDSRLTLAPEARLLTSSQSTPDGWRVTEARLSLLGFPGCDANINSHVAHLLGFCDGQRTLREAVARMAAALNVDPERVAGPALPLVRSLIGEGFLCPAGQGTGSEAQ